MSILNILQEQYITVCQPVIIVNLNMFQQTKPHNVLVQQLLTSTCQLIVNQLLKFVSFVVT